jgi:gamma-D-glutamyl-L-lysine dipeptidyl-peptidase
MSQALSDLVERARRQLHDSRSVIADIHVEPHADSVDILGSVLDRATAERLMRALRAQSQGVNWRDEMSTLVAGPDYHWALVMRPVADVRHEPSHRSERVTQALLGEPLEVLRRHESWAFVRLSDGYLGWIATALDSPPLHICAVEIAQAYPALATHVIKQPLAPCYAHPSAEPHEQVGLLPFGIRVQVMGQDGPLQRVRWPDGKLRWIATADLLSLELLPQGRVTGLRQAVGWAQRLVGVPYLWGGKTPFGYDCSGLMQMLFGMIGVSLRRDADQQAELGEPVDPESITFGDLLFFGEAATDDGNRAPGREMTPIGLMRLGQNPSAAQGDHRRDSRVTHVALALSRSEFLDSSRSGGGVALRSLDPDSPIYAPETARGFLFARRLPFQP